VSLGVGGRFITMEDTEEPSLEYIMATLAELEAAQPTRGRRRRGSNRPRGLTAAQRQAKKRRRERRDAWVAAYNELVRRLPRHQVDRIERSDIHEDHFLSELNAIQEQHARDWEIAFGRPGQPYTREEWLALQAWVYDNLGRPVAGPPRDFPTARYEEPWPQRIGKQVEAENDHDGGGSFENDFAAAEFMRRQLQRVGPVRRLKLRNGRTKPAVTAYPGSDPYPISITPDLARRLLAQLKKAAKRRRTLPPETDDNLDGEARARAALTAAQKRRGLLGKKK
jgi:hypothetical protein